MSRGFDGWCGAAAGRLAGRWARTRHGLRALALVAAMSVASVTPALAAGTSTATVHCTDYYSLIQPRGEIFKLRIAQATRLVDGYAPKCLVAASVAASVINDQSHFFSRAARVYSVRGARWNAGSWRCTRTFVTYPGPAHATDGFVTCRHVHDYGHPKVNTLISTVWFGYHAGI